jgi:hypothetical protein
MQLSHYLPETIPDPAKLLYGLVRGNMESHMERLRSMLELAAERQLNPVLRRFNIPSRREVHSLSNRIGRLERRLGIGPHSDPSTIYGIASTGTFDAIRRAELFWDEV